MNEAEDGARVIDVVSDVVCPWCYIGKRRLEAALQRLDGSPPQIHWHPFQLNPDLPAEGVDRRSYLEAKFGGARRADEIYARVRAAGASVGITFEFDRIQRQPNTLDAHRLIAWAQAHGDAEPLVERLFRAYFIEGAFIGDARVLEQLASRSGVRRRCSGRVPCQRRGRCRGGRRRPSRARTRHQRRAALHLQPARGGVGRAGARHAARGAGAIGDRDGLKRPRRSVAPQSPLSRRSVAVQRLQHGAVQCGRRGDQREVWPAGPCRSSC